MRQVFHIYTSFSPFRGWLLCSLVCFFVNRQTSRYFLIFVFLYVDVRERETVFSNQCTYTSFSAGRMEEKGAPGNDSFVERGPTTSTTSTCAPHVKLTFYCDGFTQFSTPRHTVGGSYIGLGSIGDPNFRPRHPKRDGDNNIQRETAKKPKTF